MRWSAHSLDLGWKGGGPGRDRTDDLPGTPGRGSRALLIVERLVDLVGIEPTTSSMPWKRAPSCATGPLRLSGDFSILA